MRKFDEICGYAHVKRELEQLADMFRNPEHYERLGAHAPAGLLLVGEPGLGKTLMAKCLIDASGLHAYTCRKNKRAEKMLDKIRSTFEKAAQHAPAIVFFDDMDKLSNCNYDLCDTEEFVTVQACMDEHRNTGVFVIATVNDKEKLPRSLRREGRFDRIITIEPPRGTDATAIISHYLGSRALTFDASVDEIAGIAEGFSCAFLEALVNEASIVAGYERAQTVSTGHFVRAFARVKCREPLATLGCGDEAGSLRPVEVRMREETACHEAGHIVVAELLDPGSVALALLAGTNDKPSGLTKQRAASSMDEFAAAERDIMVTLAGGIAVEQRYGTPDCGCGDDLGKVFTRAKKLMENAAMQGMLYASGKDYSSSEQLVSLREQTASVMVEQYRWRVRKMLAQHADAVGAIAGKLFQHGYILAEDIRRIMGECTGDGIICPDAAEMAPSILHAA